MTATRQDIRPFNRSGRTRQAGFGLVELMVSMLLGLILIGGVLSIFLSNQQAFRSNEGLARLQENARISFELMAREIRETDGNQCGAKLVANVVNDATDEWTTNWAEGPIRGYDKNQASPLVVPVGTASSNRVTNTAAVSIRLADANGAITVVSHNATAASFKLTTLTHGFVEGDIVMVCDNGSAAIFQITNASTGTNDTVVHNTGTVTPGNCSKGLGYPTICLGAVGNTKTFASGGVMARIAPSFWYIGINSRGGRSLYRKTKTATDEIAEGVRDMQIEYLQRDEATGLPDADWVSASSITNWTSAASKQVIAVRVTLDLESLTKVGTNQATLKRQQIFVVNLRNRVI